MTIFSRASRVLAQYNFSDDTKMAVKEERQLAGAIVRAKSHRASINGRYLDVWHMDYLKESLS
jgi:hypothetical protein